MKTLQVNIYTRSSTGIFKRARFYGYFKNPLSHFAYDLRKEKKIYFYKELKIHYTILLNQIKNWVFNSLFHFSKILILLCK